MCLRLLGVETRHGLALHAAVTQCNCTLLIFVPPVREEPNSVVHGGRSDVNDGHLAAECRFFESYPLWRTVSASAEARTAFASVIDPWRTASSGGGGGGGDRIRCDCPSIDN